MTPIRRASSTFSLPSWRPTRFSCEILDILDSGLRREWRIDIEEVTDAPSVGAVVWAVRSGLYVWNGAEWEIEPMASKRSEEQLRRTRWRTLEEATEAGGCGRAAKLRQWAERG